MARGRHNFSGLAGRASRFSRHRFGRNASRMAGIAELADFNITRWADTEILARDHTDLAGRAGRSIWIAHRTRIADLAALVGFGDLVTSGTAIAAIADMLGANDDLSVITRWACAASGGIRRRAAGWAAMIFADGNIAFTAIEPLQPVGLVILLRGVPFIITILPAIPVTAAVADMFVDDFDETLLAGRAGFKRHITRWYAAIHLTALVLRRGDDTSFTIIAAIAHSGVDGDNHAGTIAAINGGAAYFTRYASWCSGAAIAYHFIGDGACRADTHMLLDDDAGLAGWAWEIKRIADLAWNTRRRNAAIADGHIGHGAGWACT